MSHETAPASVKVSVSEGKSALIIDDDQASVAVLSKMLEQMLIQTTAFSDTSHIADRLPALDRYDVIFLDLELIGISGYTILKLIQSDPRFTGVPTVAYTSHTNQMNIGKAAGFHSFLGKPLDSHYFPSQLERILNGEPVWEVP
jgi:CheY-like chemotaxis protein